MKKEKRYSLYRHTSPSGKVYIGITCQPVEHRWNHGRGYMNIKKTPFKSTIIKYGWDNIKHEVLFTNLSEERAKHLEIELIRHYRSLGISLNFTDGGDGCHGCTPWNKGIKVPFEQSNKRKGCHLTEEHKHKLSEAHKGKYVDTSHLRTAECIEKIKLAKIGTHRTEEEKRKISENSAKAKQVLEYNLDGEIIHSFKSTVEAGKFYSIDRSNVANSCRSKTLCQGHIFLYADDSVEPSEVRYGRYRAGRAVIAKNTCTGEIKEFHSASMCARFLGYKSANSLKKAIKNRFIKNGWEVKYAA